MCLCSDFNSVRSVEERKSRNLVFRQLDADMFNEFIEDIFLVDLPIYGRLLTWYRGDGYSISRLDRFLMSDNWCSVWPNCVQVAPQRGLSDHVPLVLHVDEDNWGPRPLQMLKCSANLPDYAHFVRERWCSFVIDGWGGYVVKVKPKMIKGGLKVWHQQHTQNMEGRIGMTKARMSSLDSKGEVSDLLQEEVEELHELSVNLHSFARIQTTIC